MKRKPKDKPPSDLKARLIEDRRWWNDRRIDQRRLLVMTFDEERRSGEDRRSGVDRRRSSERRRANRRCEFHPDGGEPCRQLGVILDPTTKQWRCMEHLEASSDTP